MPEKSRKKELHKLLDPFVAEQEEKKNSVSAENVEDLISFAEDAEVEGELIDFIHEHPDGPFWDFLSVIPDGLGPGVDAEDLLRDDD